MEGKYPIIIDGAPLGTLEVKKCGARTAFAARCRMVEGLVRISVYGEGKEGYLGVMAPESGELTLTRTLSPLDMRAFPGRIESVGRAGEGRSAVAVFAPKPPQDTSPAPQPPTNTSPAPKPPTNTSPAPQPPTDTSPEPQPPTDTSPAPQPPTDTSPAPQPPTDTSPAPQPPCIPEPPCEPEPPCQPCDTFWYASPDGALVSFDGEKSYVALPPGDRRIPTNQMGEPRTIEGREYLVFVSKNGRISL